MGSGFRMVMGRAIVMLVGDWMNRCELFSSPIFALGDGFIDAKYISINYLHT